MKADLVIKNGTVATATDVFRSNIGVKDGKIVGVGKFEGNDEIDAEGMLVFPGGVDVHTHLEMPFMGATSSDDFDTGTVAAAFGGTTSIIDFAVQTMGATLADSLKIWEAKAKRSCIDYGFHMAMIDINDSTIEEMGEMVKKGVTSFKIFLAYKGSYMSDDGSTLRVLEEAKKLSALVMVHAENGDLIDYLTKKLLSQGKKEARYHPYAHPAIAEEEATGRVIALAESISTPAYIVHLTCAGALERVRRARAKGVKVYAETCPQYLLLDDKRYEGPEGAKYAMSPPLRESSNLDALWRGLSSGDLQVVSTDHCPFFMEQKEIGKNFSEIPNGIPGIETRIPLIYSEGVRRGKISLNRFVEVCCTNPAKLMGMPQKGTIAPGSDADLVIFDPEKEVTLSYKDLHQRVDYTPYEGMKVKGYPVKVIADGEVLVDNGEFVGGKKRGKFIRRRIRCPQNGL
jgi:dihydropyrimidinase